MPRTTTNRSLASGTGAPAPIAISGSWPRNSPRPGSVLAGPPAPPSHVDVHIGVGAICAPAERPVPPEVDTAEEDTDPGADAGADGGPGAGPTPDDAPDHGSEDAHEEEPRVPPAVSREAQRSRAGTSGHEMQPSDPPTAGVSGHHGRLSTLFQTAALIMARPLRPRQAGRSGGGFPVRSHPRPRTGDEASRSGALQC